MRTIRRCELKMRRDDLSAELAKELGWVATRSNVNEAIGCLVALEIGHVQFIGFDPSI